MLTPTLAVLLVAAAAGPALPAGCPSADGIAAELQRLGTAVAVAAVGAPEVTVQGAHMQVTLRGLDGSVGVREVAAPASCAERARVAAVLVSAWVGAWSAGSFPEPVRPDLSLESAPAPAGAPELPNAATAPAGPARASAGAMQLSDAQLVALRSAGARLDARDMQMADRLGRHGLVGDDLVAAYREHKAMTAAHPELASYGRAVVETIAVAQKLDLRGEDEYLFVRDRHERNRTVAQAYNARIPSGRGMVTVGSAVIGVGIVLLASGLALASDLRFDDDRGMNVTSGWGYAGRAIAITGGVGIAVGLSAAILGLYRWTAPPEGDASVSRAGSTSLRPSGGDQRGTTTRWALSPSLGPRQAGLGLVAAF